MKTTILLTVTLLIGAFQNCAPSGFDTGGSSSSSESSSVDQASNAGGGGSAPTFSGKPEPKISIQNFEQIYVTMLNLAGLPATTTLNVNAETNNTPARRIATEYMSRATSFPTSSSASSISAPLVLGATSLASAVCDGLVEKERVIADMNARVFYKNVNFTQAVSNVSAATYDAVVQSFAQEFWGRALDAEELKAFQDARTEFTANITAGQQTNAAQTRGLALLTCTAALSSFESISL